MLLTGQSLSEDELDELDAFLMSEAMPENGMDISTLDGFLAAVVLNPDVVLPSQWLPWVWDMEDAEAEPAFKDAEEAQKVMGLITRHYNMVIEGIRHGTYHPLLFELRQDDGGEFFDAEGWCEGFMLAVSVFIDAWRPVLEQHMELVAPMVLLGTNRGWKMLEESGNNKEATRQAYESIPAAVLALREYFKPQREAMARSHAGAPMPTMRREAPKVGRNVPCPCGSRKKYKKCCGAEIVH